MSRRPREMPFADRDTGRALDLPESSPKDKGTPLTQGDKKEWVDPSIMASDTIDKKISGNPATRSQEAGSFQANREQYRADSVQSVRVPDLSRSSRPAASLPLSLSPVVAASASSRVSVHPGGMKAPWDIPGGGAARLPCMVSPGKGCSVA